MKYNKLDTISFKQEKNLFIAKIDPDCLLVFNTSRNDGSFLLSGEYKKIFQLLINRHSYKDIYLRVKKDMLEKKTIKVLNDLYSNNIISIFHKDLPKSKKEKIKFNDEELDVWISLTNMCNLNCVYCYARKGKTIIDDKIIKKAVKFIFDLAGKNKVKKITFKMAGGEPFLTWDKIKKTADEIDSLRKKYSKIKVYKVIVTNGTLILNKENIKFLKKKRIQLMVSLDSLDRDHVQNRPFKGNKKEKSSIAVVNNINLLLQNKIKPYISITITKYNYNSIESLVKFLLQKKLIFGFNFLRSTRLPMDEKFYVDPQKLVRLFDKIILLLKNNPPNWDFKNIVLDKVKLSEVRKYPCGMNHFFIVINEDGSLSRCQMLKGKIKYKIGDINFLKKIKNKTVNINKEIDKLSKCKDCLWKYFCVGGCPYTRINNRSIYCDVYKKIIPKLIKAEVEIFCK